MKQLLQIDRWVFKPHLFALGFLLSFYLNTSLGQTPVLLTTSPPVGSIGATEGITFELTSNKHILLNTLGVGMNSSGKVPIDIYYRIGGVESIPGVPPVIDNVHGWVKIKSTTITANFGSILPLHEDLNLYLAPGTYGFNVHGTLSGYGPTCDYYQPWVSPISSVSDATVTLNIGPHAGYRNGLSPGEVFPNVAPYDTVRFRGSVIYTPYLPMPNEITMLSIDSLRPRCAGSNEVYVTLRNLGSNQITSTKIDWTIDGVPQPTVNFSGLIDTVGGMGAFEVPVLLGNVNLVSSRYTNIVAWTSLPNGQADPNTSNDTAYLSEAPAISSGIYTIDPAGSGPANYISFNAALDSLHKYGVCGAVVLQVTPGTYFEKMDIDSIEGASFSHAITFRGDTNNPSAYIITDSITSSNSNYIVNFNGCAYIKFEGIKVIPVLNSVQIGSTAVTFVNAAHHNQLRNCDLNAPLVGLTGEAYAVVFTKDEEVSYNNIIGNKITGGSYGIYYRGGGAYSLTPGVIISSNTVNDPFNNGMYIQYTEGAIIKNNVITSNSNWLSTNYGVIVAYGDGGLQFTGNTVIGNSLGWPLYPVRIALCDATTANHGLVANNMIHSYAPSRATYAMMIDRNNYIDVVHNNIALEGASVSSAAMYLRSYADCSFYNNNCLHYGQGYAMYDYDRASNCDYNNLATSGANIGFDRAGTGNITTLSAWRTAIGYDKHSINVDSIFTNLDSLRTCDQSIVGKGTILGKIAAPTDIDGEERSNNPNIGADEFPDLGQFSLGDDITFCEGDEVTLGNNLNVHYGDFSWSNSATTRTIEVTQAGTYSVSVNGACGGTASDTIELISYPVPTADFSATVDSVHRGVTIGFTNNSTNALGYLWDFGDSTTSTSMDAFHVYNEFGTYTVTLTVYGACDTVTTTKDIDVNYSGIRNLASGINQVKVWPNPTKDVLFIQLPTGVTSQVQVLDIQGRVMDNAQLTMDNGGPAQLDVSALQAGMYILRITTDSGSHTEHFVVQ